MSQDLLTPKAYLGFLHAWELNMEFTEKGNSYLNSTGKYQDLFKASGVYGIETPEHSPAKSIADEALVAIYSLYLECKRGDHMYTDFPTGLQKDCPICSGTAITDDEKDCICGNGLIDVTESVLKYKVALRTHLLRKYLSNIWACDEKTASLMLSPLYYLIADPTKLQEAGYDFDMVFENLIDFILHTSNSRFFKPVSRSFLEFYSNAYNNQKYFEYFLMSTSTSIERFAWGKYYVEFTGVCPYCDGKVVSVYDGESVSYRCEGCGEEWSNEDVI
jgi:hypothetical protein